MADGLRHLQQQPGGGGLLRLSLHPLEDESGAVAAAGVSSCVLDVAAIAGRAAPPQGTAAEAAAAVAAAKRSTHELCNKGLGDTDMVLLAVLLASNSTADYISLHSNSIADFGVVALLKGVGPAFLHRIKKLQLGNWRGGNRVGVVGVTALAESLFRLVPQVPQARPRLLLLSPSPLFSTYCTSCTRTRPPFFSLSPSLLLSTYCTSCTLTHEISPCRAACPRRSSVVPRPQPASTQREHAANIARAAALSMCLSPPKGRCSSVGLHTCAHSI